MNETGWNEWKNYLLNEYNLRLMKIPSIATQFSTRQKGFSTVFLITNPLNFSSVDILSDIMKIIKENKESVSDKKNLSLSDKNGDIGMIGHQFGMLENIDNLNKYFMEVYQLAEPQIQILLTSINLHGTDSMQTKNYSGNNELKFQSGDMYGPYFGLFFINLDFLQNQVKKTNWKFKLTHKQEESYSVLLYV